jgi:diguanylate cyclase (GGDEF)-like protein/PAS domain S-box-containing protein
MIDMRSVMVVQILVILVCFFILFSIWLQNRTRYKGLSCWATMMGLSCVGYILLALRSYVPDYISIIIANTLIVFAFVLFNMGVALFYQLKNSIIPGAVIIALVLAFLIFFTYNVPNIDARILVISTAFVLIYGKSLWLIAFRTTPRQRMISRGIIISLSAVVMLNMYRIGIHLSLPSGGSDLFDQNMLDNMFIILQVPLYLLLVLNMVVLVSRSLMLEVRDEEAKFNSIFHSAPYAALITNIDDAKVIEANDEMTKLLEYSKEELLGHTLLELEIWIDPNQRTSLIKELMDGGTVNGRELEFRSKSGLIFPVLFSTSIVKLNGKDYIVSTMKDISEIYRLKNELVELASHDMLTGLPNRRKFHEVSEIQLARASRSGEKLAMVMFDIDDFKCVNDKFGHDMGDKVLAAIGDRLRDFSRSADNIARHGGDEFTILLNGLKDRAEAEAALMRLFKLYETPIIVEGQPFMIGLSMGVAMYPENGISTEELLKKADRALYVAKRKGKNSIWFASETE